MESQLSSDVIDLSRGSEVFEFERAPLHMLAIRERESRTDMNEGNARIAETPSFLSDE